MRGKYVVISSLMACICLYIVEQYLGVSYVIKTLSKLLLFVGFPLIYNRFIKKSDLVSEASLRYANKKDIKLGVVFGIISFGIIFAAYFIFKGAIDLNDIVNDLKEKNITAANFVLIGIYITIGNSFLEEFFFRGFIFLNLYNMGNRKLAYVYSSLLFGLYHIAIFKTWFSIGIILICLLGLVTIGLIFDWLDTRSNNFINSWLVHIFADSAIILIGLRMFEII